MRNTPKKEDFVLKHFYGNFVNMKRPITIFNDVLWQERQHKSELFVFFKVFLNTKLCFRVDLQIVLKTWPFNITETFMENFNHKNVLEIFLWRFMVFYGALKVMFKNFLKFL